MDLLINRPQVLLDRIRDRTIFARPLFLHDTPILQLAEPITDDGVFEAVEAGGVVGRVDLSLTRMPLTGAYSGVLILVVDPLEKLPDVNRLDNYFIQLVHVNSTNQNYEEIEDEQFCAVYPGPAGTWQKYFLLEFEFLTKNVFFSLMITCFTIASADIFP